MLILFGMLTYGVYRMDFINKEEEIYKLYNEYNFLINEKMSVNSANISKKEKPYYDLDADAMLYGFADYFKETDKNIFARCYDIEGNVMAESGSMMKVVAEDGTTYYINLEKHFSVEEMEAIYKFQREQKQYDQVYVSRIDGNMEDGELIPAMLELSTWNSENHATITNDNLNTKVTFEFLRNADIETILIDTGITERKEKSQRELENIFLEKESYNLNHIMNQGGANGGFGPTYTEINMQVEYNNQTYYYLWSVTADPAYEVINNDEFKYSTKNMFVNLQIIAAILWISSFYIYKKQRLLDEARVTLSNAIAHEMKTPLAIIKNSSECIKEDINPDKNKYYLDVITDETDKMNHMVINMLTYTKLSNSQYKLTKEMCLLDELADEVIRKFKALLDEKGIKIIMESEDCKPVKCDSTFIKIVMDNFLSNALHYTQEGRSICIAVKKSGNKMRFSVMNEGQQIPKEDLDKVWDVFYRGDTSRKREGKSTGLGLAISRNILKLHKAKYGCENTSNGVLFYFIL